MLTQSTLLRNALRANAAFSFVTGLVSVTSSGTIGPLMGIAAPLIAQNGISLLVFGGWLASMSMRNEIPARQATAAAILDTLWVIGTVAVLAMGLGSLTTEGKLIAGAIGVIVATFADLQWIGLWRVTRRSEAVA